MRAQNEDGDVVVLARAASHWRAGKLHIVAYTSEHGKVITICGRQAQRTYPVWAGSMADLYALGYICEDCDNDRKSGSHE